MRYCPRGAINPFLFAPPSPQKTERHIYLVLEYCAGGDLRALIRKEGRLAEPATRHFMRDLGAHLNLIYTYVQRFARLAYAGRYRAAQEVGQAERARSASHAHAHRHTTHILFLAASGRLLIFPR